MFKICFVYFRAAVPVNITPEETNNGDDTAPAVFRNIFDVFNIPWESVTDLC